MDHILTIMESLVDHKFGIVGQVDDLQRDGAAQGFVYMTARTCNLQVINPAQQHKGFFMGCGVAADRSRAMAKAVGEAVEHYCAANYALENLPLTPSDSATFPCVQPEDFALFSAEQYARGDFPYEPFRRSTLIRWAPALDLMTETTRYVPASMVFLPYDQVLLGETPIAQQISTGLACHSNPILAAISAICEVLERDAIAITWQTMLPRSQIRPDTLSMQNRELLARVQRPGAFVVLLHLAMDHGLPVILAMMHNTAPEAPALVVAAGAHPDPERAVQKSLEELAQLQPISQQMKSRQPVFNPGGKWEHVTDFESHAAVYNYHANVRYADFLLKPRTSIAFNTIANLSVQDPLRDLQILVNNISSLKHKVLIADVTTEDVRTLGLWVLRALIPGFHPLFIGHRFRALGGARLWDVPKKLGYTDIHRKKYENPAPHPFA